MISELVKVAIESRNKDDAFEKSLTKIKYSPS